MMRSYRFKIENRPAGWAAEVTDDGRRVLVENYGMYSWEDRDTLLARLEGFSNFFLAPVGMQGNENAIVSAIAVVHPSNDVDLVLDPTWIAQVRAPRAVAMGEPVYMSDLTSVLGMTTNDVTVPVDAAVAVVLSVGWRRGIFFDFRQREALLARPRNLAENLAALYTQLAFEQRFRLTESDWRDLFDAEWFPFSALSESHIREIRRRLAAKEPLRTVIELVERELHQRLDAIETTIRGSASLAAHKEHLLYAVERYRQRDYFGAANTLFPRIEGVMRSYFRARRSTSPRVKELIVEATKMRMQEPEELQPLLMPSRFRDYLESVVFRGYDGENTDIVSRHSVAHGEVAAERLRDPATATRAMLTLEHLLIMLQGPDALSMTASGSAPVT